MTDREVQQNFKTLREQINKDTKQVEENTKKLQGIPMFDEFNTLEEYIITTILKNYSQGGEIYNLIGQR